MQAIKINKADQNGNVITGYEQVMQLKDGYSKDDAIIDYLGWLDDETVTEETLDIEIVEIDAWWDEDGEIITDDEELIIHHTDPVFTMLDATTEDVIQFLNEEFEAEEAYLNIGSESGIEYEAKCISCWTYGKSHALIPNILSTKFSS